MPLYPSIYVGWSKPLAEGVAHSLFMEAQWPS